jgi:sarcosine oxidase subunit gamma
MTERALLRYPQLTIAEPSRHRLSLLRTKRIDPQQRQGLESVLGAALPESPSASSSGFHEILWLAPGQWLIRDTDAERDISARIEEACRGALFHVTDVTDALRAVEIDGRRAGDLIAKGCSLDLHPTVFRVGQAKRSLLGQIRVLLHQVSGSCYRIYFDVSVQEHAMQWVKVSAEEFSHDLALNGDADRRGPLSATMR